jgi:cytochrome c
MNKIILAATLGAAALMVSAPAFASEDLAKKKNCMACHTVDKKLVGPANAAVTEAESKQLVTWILGLK